MNQKEARPTLLETVMLEIPYHIKAYKVDPSLALTLHHSNTGSRPSVDSSILNDQSYCIDRSTLHWK